MATEKAEKKPAKVAKMEHDVLDDGTQVFKYNAPAGDEGIPEQRYRLEDFPTNVRDFFAQFGMKTKLRNFTVPDAGEHEATPAQMAAKMAKGAALLKAGLLRVAREPGEKKAGGTLLLEAAMIYKQLRAESKGETFAGTLESVGAEIEGLSEEQLEQLKGTTTFKIAMSQAKTAREVAKQAALMKQAAKEEAEAEAAANVGEPAPE